jgi:hypothetical protein
MFPNPYLAEALARQKVAETERQMRHAWHRRAAPARRVWAGLVLAAVTVGGLVWLWL